MICLNNKNECVGCGACANACPRDAIRMVADEEGFLYPKIIKERCVDCHICEKVCSERKHLSRNKFLTSFALVNKSKEIRDASSSGGVFYEMAKTIIEKNGVVYGASFDDNFLVKHISIHEKKYIQQLMGSKYLQSPSFMVFKDVKENLQKDQIVLFSGTPCQIAGLKAYLRKDYDNLFCVELCCHAVPSPKAWQLYIGQLKRNIKWITFRSKVFGWRHYGLNIIGENGENIVLQSKEKNAYMRAFLHSLICRPSCSQCPHKPFKSLSDAVIGDFWGVDLNHAEKNDGKGISLYAALTEKGRILFEEISHNFDFFEIDSEDIYSVNGNFSHSEKMHSKRALFWDLVNEKKIPFNEAVDRCLKISLIRRIISKIKRSVKGA